MRTESVSVPMVAWPTVLPSAYAFLESIRDSLACSVRVACGVLAKLVACGVLAVLEHTELVSIGSCVRGHGLDLYIGMLAYLRPPHHFVGWLVVTLYLSVGNL